MAIREAPLLTHDELESLAAMAEAMRAIAGSNLPQFRETLSERIERLRRLVDDGHDRRRIRALAESLNSAELLDWAEALDEGWRVIDELTLKFADDPINEDDDEAIPSWA